MRISIAQINPTVGDFAGNSEKILAFARKARDEQKADMVLFPELAVSGCPPLDLLAQDSFIDLNAKTVDTLREKLPGDIAVGLGFVSRNPPSFSAGTDSSGKNLLNSYGIILGGKLVFTQAKTLFQEDGPFDEERYFASAREWKVFEYLSERIGFAFSADLMRKPESAGSSRAADPVRQYAGQGISLLCVPSAAPFIAGNFKRRLARAEQIVREENIPLVYINAAGANGEIIFDGRSFVSVPARATEKNAGAYSPALCAKAFEEDLVLWLPENDAAGIRRSAETGGSGGEDPFGVGLSRAELDELEDALVLGIRDYMKKSGFSRAHLGLSGGIDSSLAAYLGVRAAGAENFTCISMPSRFSSQGSKDDAREQAEILGCRFETLPIEDCYKAFLAALEGVFENRPFDVTEENLQPRIRGTLLMAFSNKWNSMLLTPGNKSEIAMGYCTLYGDMCGSLGPIGDLFKTEVFALCRRINERSIKADGKEMIPRAIIDKPPSAELRPNQKDEDSLPPYPVLDEILKLYLHDNLSREAIVRKGWDGELVSKIIRTTARSEFKRRQAAPLLRVSPRAFGIGRTLPVVRVLHEN